MTGVFAVVAFVAFVRGVSIVAFVRGVSTARLILLGDAVGLGASFVL